MLSRRKRKIWCWEKTAAEPALYRQFRQSRTPNPAERPLSTRSYRTPEQQPNNLNSTPSHTSPTVQVSSPDTKICRPSHTSSWTPNQVFFQPSFLSLLPLTSPPQDEFSKAFLHPEPFLFFTVRLFEKKAKSTRLTAWVRGSKEGRPKRKNENKDCPNAPKF